MTVLTLDREARLKRRIRRHLDGLGFSKDKHGYLKPGNLGKESYRSFHEHQRLEKLNRNRAFLEKQSQRMLDYFADGDEVDPTRISPSLELVHYPTWQSTLFRFAALQWSIPVSNGYGRRMRFLVWDENNNKLIGLIALGDPVFNLAARDNYIGWTHVDRTARLASLMDAYVLGAVPPYNMLLGGKLVASLLRTRDIHEVFDERYGNTCSVMSSVKKRVQLVTVTTTSALGKSSVYNRLRLEGTDYLKSIGYTRGWGHFHISDELFGEIRAYLASKGDPYADGHGYGDGPNWRLRAIKKALHYLGMSERLMKHQFVREVFICNFASNALQYLSGSAPSPEVCGQLRTVSEVGELAVRRWLIPRAERTPNYREWKREGLLHCFQVESNCVPHGDYALNAIRLKS